ncbi:MAG: hypothetical protein ACO1QB_18630 [Verrucomicrobiales bacterium]
MKRTLSPKTTPGEVISPLEHTNHADRVTTPGQQFPSNMKDPKADEPAPEAEVKEKLARPPKDHTEVTIGPTVGTTGQDVSFT